MTKHVIEPYRFLFPIGAVASLLGVLFWIPFGFGLTTTYPGLFHPDLMIAGFLSSFIAGFLMTAVPRFTGTQSASRLEFAVAVLLSAASLAGFLPEKVWVHSASFGLFVFLAVFARQRFVSRKKAPPSFFIFVGLGLVTGILGSAVMVLTDTGMASGALSAFGRLIYYQGGVLALIIGVGTQLIPALTGWAPPPDDRDYKSSAQSYWLAAGLAAVLLTTFVGEAVGFQFTAEAARAVLVGSIALMHWRIFRLPKKKSAHAHAVWLAALSLVVGLWIPLIFPQHALHALHLFFIAGVGLMTFMIATKVIYAHGGYEEELQTTKLPLYLISSLLIVSALTRTTAALVAEMYLHHLAYAAAVWLTGVSVWLMLVFHRIIRRGDAT